MISNRLDEVSRQIKALSRIVADDLVIDDIEALIADSDDLHDQHRALGRAINELDHYINEKRLARGNSLGANE